MNHPAKPLRYTDGNLKNVWLRNGFRHHGTPYGKGLSIDDPDGLTFAISDALAAKDGALSGVEFRYLRLALKLSQVSLAHLLGVTENTIYNYEKAAKVPATGDKLARLLYQSHRHGDRAVREVVASLNFSDRIKNQKIVFESHRGKWKQESLETAS